MDIRDRSALKASARDALGAAPNARQLILIFAGASAALSLLVSLLSFLLDQGIAGTNGLSGIQLRSILTTGQSLLSMATVILLPFWNYGYTHSVLRLSRKQSAAPASLLMGFRRFGPALRLLLLKEIIYILLGIISMNVGTILLSFTPLAQPFYDAAMDTDMLITGNIDEATLSTLMDAMMPMLMGCLVIFVLAVIAVNYRLRLADFYLMDEPGCGAFEALRRSIAATRGTWRQLLMLDISFWWFYAAQGAVLLLSYADMLLPLLGVELSITGNTAYFFFYVLALIAQLVLFYFCRNRVEVTYALFYHTTRKERC